MVILPLAEELLRGGTPKSCKFLLARRHKYHTPTFLVRTTCWRLTNNFLLPELNAFLVPQDELVMKSYIHVQLAIVETHYYNLNANIKNQDYWLLTSNVGIKIQKGIKLQHRTKKTQGYFPTFWALPVCRTVQSEKHNLLYTITLHLMATF